MKAGAVKSAELASGLGAIVLGAGLALLAPATLRSYGGWFLVVGVLVHGVAMTLKYRMESRQGPLSSLERVLFWLCWACLGLMGLWIATALWPG